MADSGVRTVTAVLEIAGSRDRGKLLKDKALVLDRATGSAQQKQEAHYRPGIRKASAAQGVQQQNDDAGP